MSRSTLPLFPSDDGWPYPDDVTFASDLVDDVEPDLDAMELRATERALDCLSASEREAVRWRFGLQGCDALDMRTLALKLGCSRVEARDVLGGAIDKLRVHLNQV